MAMEKRQVGNLVDPNGNPLFAPEPPRRRRGRRLNNYSINTGTGLGVIGADKTLGVSTRSNYISDQEAEDIYVSSSLAAKAVDIPVQDSLMRWRTFEGQDAELFQNLETRYKIKDRISRAAKDSRVYGTALVVMALNDDAWEEPLNIDMIRPGMLRNLIVVDRRSISNVNIDLDLLSPSYGEAYSYDITFPRNYQTFRVDATRCLRFDGLIANSSRDFYHTCLLYTSPSPRDRQKSRMPSSA